MFSSVGLFKQVSCPEQPHCFLSNCFFAHPTQSNGEAAEIKILQPSVERSHEDYQNSGQPRKKRRISEKYEEDDGEKPRKPLKALPPSLPKSVSRDVSPPPLKKVRKGVEFHSAPDARVRTTSPIASATQNKLPLSRKLPVETSLNPRMLHNPPASHAIRMQLIKMLHEHMVRLNDEIMQSKDHSISKFQLTSQELIANALGEEEDAAKQNPAVYSNVVKLRITKLKKMKVLEWASEWVKKLAKFSVVSPTTVREAPKVVETGLSLSQEISLLSRLVANQFGGLAKFGYVPSAPNEEEIAQARKGVEAARGWELCDRCNTRFQIFLGRREEDGALTSGGECVHHSAKPRRPPVADKAERSHREPIYACCSQTVGISVGCTIAETHVFKISEAKRLALVMPFEKTPPNSQTRGSNGAVCFDCEMGYTTMGLELIRVTATSWLSGDALLDVLVRPLGEILDLNSRFSGIWPKDYAGAVTYESSRTIDTNSSQSEKDGAPSLRIVESPVRARELLFELLTPETPLIGHALDNDLNAMRMIHPTIIDTVLLYPHPGHLPIRYGLKALMKQHLDRDIQTGGAMGHDSKEDARAAGDLVRLKVSEMWKTMKRQGWTVRGTEFCPPPPPNISTKSFPCISHEAKVKA